MTRDRQDKLALVYLVGSILPDLSLLAFLAWLVWGKL